MLRNLECPVGFSQREICANFIEGNLAQFGRFAQVHIYILILYNAYLEGNLTMHSTHFIYGYMASDIW